MSKPQHLNALDIAHQRKQARAEIHQRVRATQDYHRSLIEIAMLLAATPAPCLGSMRVEELLQWIWARGWDKRRLIQDALWAADCSEFKLVRDLTDRQRMLIVDTLTSHAYGRAA